MWTTEHLIILSDLHLGPAEVEWAFAESTEVAGLLDWVAEEVSGPCHIVFAGDIFDCLLRDDALQKARGFEPLVAPIFITSVLDSHPRLGAALRRIVRSPDHELSFLSGNHDPELILPSVQKGVESWLQPANAQPPLRWVVYGEGVRFEVGGVRVLVEHGDLFDAWNRIDHDGLRLAVARFQRGLEVDGHYRTPVGASLFREFVLPLGSRYPWITALKPEREAVFPLIHMFLPPHQRPSFRKALGLALPSLMRSFISTSVGKGRPAELRRAGLEGSERRRLLMDWLAGEERATARRGTEKRKVQALIRRLRNVSAEDTYFDVTAPDRNAKLVSELLNGDLDVLVCGHTHAAKAYPLGKGLYLNTGAWQRLLQLPNSTATDFEWGSFLDGLQSGKPAAAWKRTFVHIFSSKRGSGAEAALLEWKDFRVSTLRSFSFEPSTRRWRGTV
jgi:UDP-2,3-diacylglucosamine pyrophosphatase LpxH